MTDAQAICASIVYAGFMVWLGGVLVFFGLKRVAEAISGLRAKNGESA